MDFNGLIYRLVPFSHDSQNSENSHFMVFIILWLLVSSILPYCFGLLNVIIFWIFLTLIISWLKLLVLSLASVFHHLQYFVCYLGFSLFTIFFAFILIICLRDRAFEFIPDVFDVLVCYLGWEVLFLNLESANLLKIIFRSSAFGTHCKRVPLQKGALALLL